MLLQRAERSASKIPGRTVAQNSHEFRHLLEFQEIFETVALGPNALRALPDPKPLVVGMEWVVQCAEKRTHENETRYLIEVDERRKPMLPRLMSGGVVGDGDYSFDGSSFVTVDVDAVTPLERARLRKAVTQGI
ncbi:hypothetical protein B0H14DRAFT_2620407 [Mycena olivaceomarginata]|nr:hypothetical protein B0H14DRAFT_2620407 [Mycena olivaceomarginata]